MQPTTRITELSEFIRIKILKQPDFKIEPHTKLLSSGLIDSLHIVDLALFVEDRYNVRIDDTELNAEHFDTLLQLDEIIRQRL